jgi:glutathione S-transferase
LISYVVITAATSVLVGVWHGARVNGYRRAAKIPYPQPYATPEQISTASPEMKQKMYLFNCAQRSHANWDENFPSTLVCMLLAGLYSPRWAAGCGAFWLANRLIYAVGYTLPNKTEGKGRLYGELMWPSQLALIVMTGLWGWNLLK